MPSARWFSTLLFMVLALATGGALAQVAGAGTYAIGRAASAFFIGGVSLKDARQKYLATRKKASRKPHLLEDSKRASKSLE